MSPSQRDFKGENQDTASGRLLRALQRLILAATPAASIRTMFVRAFQVDSGDVYRIVADLSDLVADAKAEVNRLENVDYDLLMNPLETIEAAVRGLSIDNPWEHVSSHLDSATMVGLQHVAAAAGRSAWARSPVDQEVLSELLQQVVDLRDEVLASELPAALKEFLVELIAEIEHALTHYWIRGEDGLREAFAKITGALILRSDLTEDLQKRRAVKEPEASKFWTILSRLSDIASVFQGAAQIAATHPTIRALLGGGPL